MNAGEQVRETMMHLLGLPIVLLVLLLVGVVRLVTAPLRWGRYHRRGCGWGGYGYRGGWGGYGDGGYGYGRRRYGAGGGLFTVLGLLALERMFGRRW